jgi:hypothetical protein
LKTERGCSSRTPTWPRCERGRQPAFSCVGGGDRRARLRIACARRSISPSHIDAGPHLQGVSAWGRGRLLAQDTPSWVSKARAKILDIIVSTAHPGGIIGLANQIGSASVCPLEADRQLPRFVGRSISPMQVIASCQARQVRRFVARRLFHYDHRRRV